MRRHRARHNALTGACWTATAAHSTTIRPTRPKAFPVRLLKTFEHQLALDADNGSSRKQLPDGRAGSCAPPRACSTRPIFHKTDATICGHVFCSFLALVLRDELFRRMDSAGVTAEWDDILRDLNALTETAITYNGKTFVVRSNVIGVAGKIAQCVGVRLPNTVRQVDVEKEVADPSP